MEDITRWPNPLVPIQRKAEWTRPRHFAGYYKGQWHLFRAYVTPLETDGLPYAYCMGPYRSEGDCVAALNAQQQYRNAYINITTAPA